MPLVSKPVAAATCAADHHHPRLDHTGPRGLQGHLGLLAHQGHPADLGRTGLAEATEALEVERTEVHWDRLHRPLRRHPAIREVPVVAALVGALHGMLAKHCLVSLGRLRLAGLATDCRRRSRCRMAVLSGSSGCRD